MLGLFRFEAMKKKLSANASSYQCPDREANALFFELSMHFWNAVAPP